MIMVRINYLHVAADIKWQITCHLPPPQQQQQQQQKIKKGKERKINWTPNFLQYDCSKTHHRYTE